MLHLEIKTKLSLDEALSRLKSFFSKGGLGLEIEEETPECLNFTGGGGFVNATVCTEKEKTRIDLQTQEWEEQVKKFASSLP